MSIEDAGHFWFIDLTLKTESLVFFFSWDQPPKRQRVLFFFCSRDICLCAYSASSAWEIASKKMNKTDKGKSLFLFSS